MNETGNNKKKRYKYFEPKKILYAGILLAVISPFLLTINTSCKYLDFTNTGEIGDTIGGITAPIVNLVGAILVYFALEAQIEANEQIQKQLKEQKEEDEQKKIISYAVMQIDLITKEIDNFTYAYVIKVSNTQIEKSFEFKGSSAIYTLVSRLQRQNNNLLYIQAKNKFPKITELRNLLILIQGTVAMIRTKVKDEHDRKFLIDQISYQCSSKIFPSFTTEFPTQENNQINIESISIIDELTLNVNTLKMQFSSSKFGEKLQ